MIMPDPTKSTLSATQTPALFGVSPYLTRWMLLRHFIHGDPLDGPAHNRLDWGLKLQPLILQQAVEDLHLEVRPNAADVYIRRGLLGCTRDAEIICPDRGPGSLETKCVFDLGVWTRDWDGGKKVPKHYEIQLQQQMFVGDGNGSQYQWGVLAAWCCGEMRYFERKPVPLLWDAFEEEAAKFFADVEARREGEPFGESIEMTLMNKVFQLTPKKVIDLRDDPDAFKLAEDIRLWDASRKERLLQEKTEDALKAKWRARVKDAEEVLFVNGIKINVTQVYRKGHEVKPSTYSRFDVYVPDNLGDKDELVSHS